VAFLFASELGPQLNEAAYPDDTIVFAIEPSDGYELRDILETADPVAGSINWR